MKYKIGETLWLCTLDDETGRPSSYDQFVVRTKRGGKFFAVLKEKGLTWVKKSKRHGDWGWDDSIPDYCRYSCKVGEKFEGLERTKPHALRTAKRLRAAREKRMQKRYNAEASWRSPGGPVVDTKGGES